MYRFFLMVLLFLGSTVFSQSKVAKVEFAKLTHDFGRIEEGGGDVVYTFEFKNTGDNPFVINTIGVSCGCTTPQWDKAPVMAGKSGKITVMFDPLGRPGFFEKTISVMCNVEGGVIKLSITGNVNPRPRTISDDYPFVVADGLRIGDRIVDFGTITRGVVSETFLPIANNSDKAVTVAPNLATLPKYATILPAKITLAPKERSEIRVKFDASKIDKWGLDEFSFGLIVNGVAQDLMVGVRAILVENFKNLTKEQLRKSPRSEFSSYFYHFSDQPKGAKLERDFYISNAGEDDLVIRHIDFDSSKIEVKTSNKTIKKGETETIKIALKNTNVAGRVGEVIRVITNDPLQPVRDIRIMANIK